MRILMLNNEFPPLGGGTATANYYVLREFARRGISVDLVTSTPEAYRFEEASMGESVRIFRVPINNRNLHHQNERELLTYLVRGLVRARELIRTRAHGAYDLCHAWSSVPAGALAWLVGLECRLPYIVDMRGSDVPGYDVRYGWLYPVITPIIRLIWNGAAARTTNSFELRQLARGTTPGLEIEVIPNGVDLVRFKPASLDEHDKRGADRVEVLCVARLVQRKGIDDLIEAVPLMIMRCPNVHVTIVGRGDYEAALLRKRAELGLEDRVEFAGKLPHSQMPGVYARAHIFVLPSLQEGMPNAMMEAMASGLPVVTTYTGGTCELVRGNGIVIPMKAPSAIADAIVDLAEDASLRRAMGQRSRAIAETMGWDLVADRYLSLYEKTLGRSPVPAVRASERLGPAS